MKLTIFSSRYDPMNEKAATTAIAKDSTIRSCGFPKSAPFGPAGLISVEAKIPVASTPHILPAPWHAKTSSASSKRLRLALQFATKLDVTPTTSPMKMAGVTPTYPAAGVIATSPQTAPTAIPTAEGFPFRDQSTSIQLTAAAAAAILVLTIACTAMAFAESELPPLNPNQPNHSMAAPRMTYGMLLGRTSFELSIPFLFPITMAAARAETPAVM